MKILKFPDPTLFQVAKPVTVFGPELIELLDLMWATMSEAHGMGLAANQVGLPWQMFVMEDTNEKRVNLVNPVIVKSSILTINLKEGCLSAPGEFIIVPSRLSWVQVHYLNEKGEAQSRVFKDIWAVCVQHEIEHLDGKGFMESASIPKMKRKELTKKWGFNVK